MLKHFFEALNEEAYFIEHTPSIKKTIITTSRHSLKSSHASILSKKEMSLTSMKMFFEVCMNFSKIF